MKLQNLIMINGGVLFTLFFVWLFAPIFFPLFLIIGAGVMIVVGLGFYIVFAWEWFKGKGL